MHPRYFVVVFITATLTMLLLLTGCGNRPTALRSNVLSQAADVNAVAILKHSPSGTADLSWNPHSQELTVRISLIGLIPDSTHPAHIHKGSCTETGSVIYPLKNVVADSHGAATSTTVIRDVKDGIPAAGWLINVHNGPTLTTAAQFLPITCGEITDPQGSVKSAQSLRILLGSTGTPNQSASGTAQLAYTGDKLQVTITMAGLVPGSIHAAHIHNGSCAEQGNVRFPLQPVKADASGNGYSRTDLPASTKIPTSGWYINVHRTTDMSTQTQTDPIACGDIVPAH